jgi:hypothetical protein
MERTAIIDQSKAYRYHLGRVWDPRIPQRCCFIMLNPSTADAEDDDPTIRRCVGFAKAWGFGGLDVLNLYAYRATDPSKLFGTKDAIGPDNDLWIRRKTTNLACQKVVGAWGAASWAQRRAREVRRLVPQEIFCLGHTKAGHPRHPLYARATAELVPL